MNLSKAYYLIIDKLEAWAIAAVKLFPNFIVALIFIVIIYFTARFLRTLIQRILNRVSHNSGINTLLSNSIFICVLIMGLFIVLGILNLDKTVTSLLAGAGIIGLGLSFAFQDIAQNYISGISIAIRKPFRVGEIIETTGKTGIVESINLRTTTLRALDGEQILIPNKEIFQKIIINYSQTEYIKVNIPLSISHKRDLEDIRTIITSVLQKHSMVVGRRKIELYYSELKENSIKMDISFWIKCTSNIKTSAKDEAIILIKKALDDNGISLKD